MSGTREKMSQNYSPFVNAAFDLQKQWTDAALNLANVVTGENSAIGGMDPFAVSKAWTEGMRATIDQSLSATAAATKGIPNLLDHLQQAASAYTSLLNLWAGIAQQGEETPDATDASGGAKAIFDKFFEQKWEFWPGRAFTPDLKGVRSWQQASASMMGNWTDYLRELGRRAGEEIADADPTGKAAHHFYQSWLNAYNSTIGRMINVTPIGPQLYEFEKYSKSADTYLKYQAATFDFHAKMLSTGVQALKEVLSEASKLFEKEFTEEALDQFFHLLMSVGERRYHELFTSPLFCQSLESMVTTGLDFQKAWNEVTEEMLRSTPIVTQTQADEMHREIYLLKKRVSALEKRLGESDSDQGD